MNTLVNFETAKLLKEKGFDGKIEQGYYLPHPDIAEINSVERDVWILLPYNPLLNQVIAPTIAEVVMWLYDKHGIWIIADPCVNFECWTPGVFTKSDTNLGKYKGLLELNTPTEAYEAAIIYTLKNLI